MTLFSLQKLQVVFNRHFFWY